LTGDDITLSGDGKSFIQENTARKESDITPMPLYTQDSDQTDVFDFGGTVKTLTILGVYVDSSGISGLKVFVDDMEAIIQGAQDQSDGYPLTFTDDLRGTIKVKVADFESTLVSGDVTFLTWTLKLIQSSTNS
jgi:hypothetical protein